MTVVVEGATAVHPVALAAADDLATTKARISPRDTGVLVGCAVAALAADWLIFERFSHGSGAVGFWLCWYLGFLGLVYIVTRENEGHLGAIDRLTTVVVWSGGLGLLVPLVLVIGFVVAKGYHALTLGFFYKDLKTVGPLQAATAGGGAHAVIGTLEQVGSAVLVAVPLGVLTAVYLNEVGGRLKRPVRLFVDAMSGLPSIVAGLFIYAVVLQGLHQGFSGSAAAISLAILMLPTITRTSEEVLRLVPSGLREASFALGSTQWRTVWSVVLPTARSGLVTAVLLGVARAVGETAPLILTSLYSPAINTNLFHGEQASLPTLIYFNYGSSQLAQQQRAFTAALVLIVLVLVLFTLARILGNRKPGGRRLLRPSKKVSP